MNITETKIEQARLRAIERNKAYDNPPVKKEEPEVTEKAQLLAETINSMDSLCTAGKADVRRLVEVLTGESLPKLKSMEESNWLDKIQHGQLLYGEEVGFGLICKGGRKEYSSYTKLGVTDYGSLCESEYSRAATEEEINKYFSTIAVILEHNVFDEDFSECFKNKTP